MNSVLPASPAPLIRISFFFCKKPSISYTDFYTYWRNTHGQLAVESQAFRDAGIVKYVQMINPGTSGHQNSNLQIGRNLAEMGSSEETKQDGWLWDACSELYVRNWEDYLKFTASEDFVKVLGPDGAKIVDADKGMRVLVGVEDELFLGSNNNL